jgi:hypothetical protein
LWTYLHCSKFGREEASNWKRGKGCGSKPLNSTDVEASTFSFCTWTGLRATWILSSSFLFAERQAWG